MSDINGKSRPAKENDFCRIEITIDRTTDKRTINISTEEDITDFDIEDTEGWSFEQLDAKYDDQSNKIILSLDAKYDELQAALEELEDDPPSDEEAIDAWDERCDRIRDLMDELEDKMDEM